MQTEVKETYPQAKEGIDVSYSIAGHDQVADVSPTSRLLLSSPSSSSFVQFATDGRSVLHTHWSISIVSSPPFLALAAAVPRGTPRVR